MDIQELSLNELKQLAKEYGIKITGKKRESLIKEITDYQRKNIEGISDESNEIEEESVSEMLNETEIEKIDSKILVAEEKHEKTLDINKLESIDKIEDIVVAVKAVPSEVIQKNQKEEIKHELKEIDLKEELERNIFKPKLSYSPLMIVNAVLNSFDAQTKNNIKTELSVSEQKIINLISKDLEAAAPYDEEQFNEMVQSLTKNFKFEIIRLLEKEKQKGIVKTKLHENWENYLKLYKLTPEKMIERYPNHKDINIFKEIIELKKQK